MARLDWVNGLKWRQLWEYSCSSSSGKSVPVGIFVCCRIYTTLWRKRCWSISSRPSGVGWSGPTQILLLYNQKASCSCCWAVSEQSCSHIAFEQRRQQQQQPTTTDALSSLFSSSSSRHKNGKQQHVDLSLSHLNLRLAAAEATLFFPFINLVEGKRRDENVYATDGHLIHTYKLFKRDRISASVISGTHVSLSLHFP